MEKITRECKRCSLYVKDLNWCSCEDELRAGYACHMKELIRNDYSFNIKKLKKGITIKILPIFIEIDYSTNFCLDITVPSKKSNLYRFRVNINRIADKPGIRFIFVAGRVYQDWAIRFDTLKIINLKNNQS